MKRAHQTMVVALCALLVSGSPGVSERAPGNGTQSLPGDPRLNTLVNDTRGQVYLGELLEALQKQSHVPLQVDDSKGPVSGIQLVVYLRARSLREVMDALQLLLQHRFDTWEWASTPGGKRYVLRHERSPEAAHQAARVEILQQWSADVKAFHDIAKLREPLRSERSRSRPDLFPGDSVPPGPLDAFGSLSDADLDLLLRTGEVHLDAGRLRQGVFDRENSGFPTGVGGSATHVDGSSRVYRPAGFSVTWRKEDTGPTLWLRNGRGLSLALVGDIRWDITWGAREAADWLRYGAPEMNDLMARQMRGETGLGWPLPVNTVPRWIYLTEKKQARSVLADLVFPRVDSTIGNAWLGRTPELTFASMALYDMLQWKRSGEIDLLRHQTHAINPRRHLVAWKQIKELRRAVDRQGGYPGMTELLQLAELAPEQLLALSEEFPNAKKDAMAWWRPVLRFYANLHPTAQRRLFSTDGLPFRDTGLVARATLAEAGRPPREFGFDLLQQEFNRATVFLRVEEVPAPAGVGDQPDAKQRRLVWEVHAPEGGVRRAALRLERRRPLDLEWATRGL